MSHEKSHEIIKIYKCGFFPQPRHKKIDPPLSERVHLLNTFFNQFHIFIICLLGKSYRFLFYGVPIHFFHSGIGSKAVHLLDKLVGYARSVGDTYGHVP